MLIGASALAAGPASAYPNETFDTAQRFSDLPFTAHIDTAQVSTEPGYEPGNACSNPKRSLWYRFEPAVDAQVRVDTIGSLSPAVVAVFVGSSTLDLRQVACASSLNDDGQLLMGVAAGRVYYIQVGGESTAGTPSNLFVDETGEIQLNVTEIPGPIYYRPPLNDNRADAEAVDSLPLEDHVYVHSASFDIDDPGYGGVPRGPDPFPNSAYGNAWYEFAPESDIFIRAQGWRQYPAFIMELWEVQGPVFTSVARGIGPYSNLPSDYLVLGAQLRAGKTYLLEVSGGRGAFDEEPVILQIDSPLVSDLRVSGINITKRDEAGGYDFTYLFDFSGEGSLVSWIAELCPAGPVDQPCSTIGAGTGSFATGNGFHRWRNAGCVGDARIRVTATSFMTDPDMSNNVLEKPIALTGSGHGVGGGVCPVNLGL